MPQIVKPFTRNTPNLIDSGVGKVRRISHKLYIGEFGPFFFTDWYKDEMAYSAGSSMQVNMPMRQFALSSDPVISDLVFDLMNLSQQNQILPIKMLTSVWHDNSPIHTNEVDFYGLIDTIDGDFDSSIYTVWGKSFAELLNIPKITEIFSSPVQKAQTIAQAIKSLVTKYGSGAIKTHILGVDYGKPYYTETIGKLVTDKQIRAITNISPWDLMEDFARISNSMLYFKNDVLYFHPWPDNILSGDITQLTNVSPTMTFTWGKDILSLKVRHSPISAHDIEINVKSWQKDYKKPYSTIKTSSDQKLDALAQQLETGKQTAQEKYNKSLQKAISHGHSFWNSGQVGFKPVKVSNKQRYEFTVADISPQDADDLALKILKDISKREFIVTLKVLGSPIYHPIQFVKIIGTNTVIDQVYAIQNIHTETKIPESGGESTGYVTTFTLINHMVQTVGSSIG